jgi:hypothetical protein
MSITISNVLLGAITGTRDLMGNIRRFFMSRKAKSHKGTLSLCGFE